MGKQNSLRDIHKDAVIAKSAKVHKCVYIEGTVKIGERCIVKPFAFIPNGVTLEDDVFVGPNVTFTNDKYPILGSEWILLETTVKRGASIGAGAVICPGVTIGEYAMVGAGSVVTKNVPAHTWVMGNPAQPKYLDLNLDLKWRDAYLQNKDPRGELKEVLDDPLHINIIEIKKGYARGGHSHDYEEWFFIAKGTVDYFEGDVSRPITDQLHEGDKIATKKNVPHYLVAVEDSILVEVRDKGIKFEANEYKPFRDIVNSLMQKDGTCEGCDTC